MEIGAFLQTPSGSVVRLSGNTASVTDRAYTGHRGNNLPDDDLGLIYMNARFYLPGSGRFASADTIVPDPADPQSFNRYSYGLNNPVKYRDPTGHAVDCGITRSGDCGDDNYAKWVDHYIKHHGYSDDGESRPTVVDAPVIHAVEDRAHGGDVNAQEDLIDINNAIRYYKTASDNGMCSDGYGGQYPCSQLERYQTTCNYWEACWESEHITMHSEGHIGPFAWENVEGTGLPVEQPPILLCMGGCIGGGRKRYDDGRIERQAVVGFGAGIRVKGYAVDVAWTWRWYSVRRGHQSESGLGMYFDLNAPFIGYQAGSASRE